MHLTYTHDNRVKNIDERHLVSIRNVTKKYEMEDNLQACELEITFKQFGDAVRKGHTAPQWWILIQ